MDKSKRIEFHKKVAENLKRAAECHEKAAKLVENDDYEKAGHASFCAFGCLLKAKELIKEAAIQVSEEHCKKQ